MEETLHIPEPLPWLCLRTSYSGQDCGGQGFSPSRLVFGEFSPDHTAGLCSLKPLRVNFKSFLYLITLLSHRVDTLLSQRGRKLTLACPPTRAMLEGSVFNEQ